MKTQQIIILSLLLILLGSLFNCSDKKFESVEDVIYANAEYMTKEDLSGVMSTVHPESVQFSSTELMVESLFERYDLEFIIEEIEIIEQSDYQTEVNFTQVTRKINGTQFKNNRVKGTHTLKKKDGSWYIFDTKILTTRFID